MANGKTNGTDNSTTILVAVLVTTLILSFVSFIPRKNLGNISIKRANLLSDMVEFDDEVVSGRTSKDILDTSFLTDLKPVKAQPQKSTAHHSDKTDTAPAEKSDDTDNSVNEETDNGTALTEEKKPLPMPAADPVAIEDFSAGGKMMRKFYNALTTESGHRTVRIAFLGDSFIESDIVTADVREQLQDLYGGEGVGFVPFADPLAKYRPTVTHTYGNWDCYNLLKKKKAPEHYQQDFFVSGLVCVAHEGATCNFESTSHKRHIAGSRTARLLFKSRGESEIQVVVNGTDTLRYTPEPSDAIQQILIDRGTEIRSLSLSLPHSNDFVGYGAVFENYSGVSVHNFGLRSNSGLALFSSNPDVNRQIDDMMNYDLVVLEYGLNVMQHDVTDYTYYGNQLRRLIDYVRQCFPSSAILVMSVGDVGTKQDERIVTSPAVEHMIAAQRAAAYDKGVAFWNLFNVMGGENSMQQFVAQGWAAKDYTHINHKGGSVIAGKLLNTMTSAIKGMEGHYNTAAIPVQERVATSGTGRSGGKALR